MTMKNPQTCLSAEMLRRLSHDELSPAELKDVEDHVSDCDRCRQLLDVPQSDPQWRDQIVPILRSPVETQHAAGDHDERGIDGESLESILRLLGPTDDPHMLGRIGSYEVVGVIGRGGMGVVFKAYEGALNRFVAIKMLLPHLATSGAARKRFAREGQAAAAVIDDNVMPIYSVAEWQGVPYLVTQYSRGATLQNRIQDQGPLELKEILRIGMQTARGLAAAHAQGLVHRDVKPSNILLDGTVERALLTDFGLARAVDDASITRTGIIAGTPQYMSPEQARGGSVDARSDLFSLGCVLYVMCTGRPPFRADSSYAILRMITDDEPRSIREINPDVPEWLCKIIRKLMAKSAVDRFESAAVVATLLEQCLAHVHAPTRNLLPRACVMFRPSLLKRSLSIMSDKRILSLIAFTLLIAAVLIPWPIAAVGRDEPAIIFAGISALLAICFAVLSRAEYFSRLILWTVGLGLGLIVVGLSASVPWYFWNRNQALREAVMRERFLAEQQRVLAEKARDAEEKHRATLEENKEARIRESEQVAAALNRMNARSVVEAYVAAALGGRVEQATSLAKGTPAERKQIESLPRLLNIQRLVIKSVYMNDPAKPTTALATSEAVKLTEKQPDGQRDGFLVLTLTMSDEGWLVTDIDFESEEGAEDELKRFREANPSAVDVPQTAASSGSIC
jgi:serine/threonine protein kinase